MKLVNAYKQLRIQIPLDESNHVGPLIDKAAVESYKQSIEKCKAQGGIFVIDGGVSNGDDYGSGCYVKPCIAEVKTISPLYNTKPLRRFYILLNISH